MVVLYPFHVLLRQVITVLMALGIFLQYIMNVTLTWLQGEYTQQYMF